MNAESKGGIPLRLKEPVVKLPKAVQLQMENVRRLESAKAEEVKAAVKERFETDTPSGSHLTETPEVETQNLEPVKTEVKLEVKPEPIVNSEPSRDAQYWEHRFKTNQGIHEAEKTRFKSTITTLENKLNDLEKRFSELGKVSREVDVTKYVNADELETYGKDMLTTVARTAHKIAGDETDHRIQEAVSREITPLRNKLEDTEARLAQTQQDKFWDHLNTAVNSWPSINNNPKFHEWLGGADPFTGYSRQQLLTSAEQALDSNRVVAIFNAFLQTIPASNKPTTQEIEKRVVPDPIGQTAQATNTQPEIASITRPEISKFYKEKAIGRWKNRPQEAEQMEKRIKAAIASGNVF